MAPTATMRPWPGIRRGTLMTVPMPPGLVSVAVVPWKSASSSLESRARLTMSLYWPRNSAKRQALRPLDVGHEELALAALLDVDGEAEGDGLWRDPLGVAFFVAAEGVLHRGHLLERAHEGVGDEVRVAHLLAARSLLAAVDEPPVLGHQLDRHVADARGDGQREAGLHVVHDARGDALERGDLGALGERDLWRGGMRGRWRGRACGGRRRGRRRGLWRGLCRGVGSLRRRSGSGRGSPARGPAGWRHRRQRPLASAGRGGDDLAVAAADDHRAGVEVGEELAPALAHGVRVAEVLRVEVFDVAAVVSEGVHWRERVRAGGAESASGEGNAGVFAPIPEDSPYTPAARPPEATARR